MLFLQPNGEDLYHYTDGYPSWSVYLEHVAKDGAWGDHVILVAAAYVYNTPICVISSLPGCDNIIINPDLPVCHGTDALVLGHVHEEHYVSLKPIQGKVDYSSGGGSVQSEAGMCTCCTVWKRVYVKTSQYWSIINGCFFVIEMGRITDDSVVQHEGSRFETAFGT